MIIDDHVNIKITKMVIISLIFVTISTKTINFGHKLAQMKQNLSQIT